MKRYGKKTARSLTTMLPRLNVPLKKSRNAPSLHPNFLLFRTRIQSVREFGCKRKYLAKPISDQKCQKLYGKEREPFIRNVLRKLGWDVDENAPRAYSSDYSKSSRCDGLCKNVPSFDQELEFGLEIKTLTSQEMPETLSPLYLGQLERHLLLYNKPFIVAVTNTTTIYIYHATKSENANYTYTDETGHALRIHNIQRIMVIDITSTKASII